MRDGYGSKFCTFPFMFEIRLSGECRSVFQFLALGGLRTWYFILLFIIIQSSYLGIAERLIGTLSSHRRP
jgi:hypothetical protein